MLKVNHHYCCIVLTSVQGILLNEARRPEELIYNFEPIMRVVEYESLRRPQRVVFGLAHIWVLLLHSALTFLLSPTLVSFLALVRGAR